MCADFSQFMSKPAGQAKRPPALPIGDYPGVIKSYEVGDDNQNHTPYVRFHIGLIGWPIGATPDPDVDLSKRQLRRDFYLTDDALWRLDAFIREAGIEPDGTSPYQEYVPRLVGMPVTVEVQHYINKKNSEIGNQVGKLTASS